MKKGIFLSSILAISIVVSFSLGYIVRGTIKNNRNHDDRVVRFYTSNKKVRKELDLKEKNAMKMFISLYEECLKNRLNEEDNRNVHAIQEEVLEMAKDNTKLKFRISELKSSVGAKGSVKKVRLCQKHAYKHVTKRDRRLVYSAMSKLDISDVISIFHGIR